MRKFHFLFVLLATAISFGQSVGWNFTAPSGEDIGVIIDGGSGPSTYGLIVGDDGSIYQAVTGIGLNGGKGILGSDATGLVAEGYHGYPAILATQHGTAAGISASGYSHGVFGGATGPSDPIGVLGTGTNGSSPVGVKGSANTTTSGTVYPVGVLGEVSTGSNPSGVKATATTNVAYSWPTALSAVAQTGSNPMSTSGIRVSATGAGLTSPNDNAYGIWATGLGAGGLNYGIYAEGTTYAGRFQGNGLFNGNVTVTGTCACYPSDEKLKKNVKPLNKGLDVVMALEPKAYDMKVQEFKGKLTLAEGPQVGMIAQEVEKVMPELITKVSIPGHEAINANGKITKTEGIDYKSLNYVGLIPVLVKAIQEQEAKIQALERKLVNR